MFVGFADVKERQETGLAIGAVGEDHFSPEQSASLLSLQAAL